MSDDLEHRVFEIIKAEANIASVSSDSRISDLGMDSLEFIDLMMVLSAQLWPIPESRWGDIKTVGDIVTALQMERN